MGSGASKETSVSNESNIQVEVEEEYTDDTSQRVVLITGCSTGIGLALSSLLANDSQKRFKVYATMRNLSKKEALEQTTSEVIGDLVVIKELDVCSDLSVKSVVCEIIEKEGRIDVLVNNAGLGLFCVAECASIEKVKKVFETNVFGLMRVTNYVIPYMKNQQSGHIVNIGSVVGIAGAPFSEFYSASKFAVEGFTEALAPILSKFNVKCTIIEPGPVATNFALNAKAMRDDIDVSSTDEKTKSLLKSALQVMYHSWTTLNQTPDEIAALVKKVLLLKRPHFRYQPNDKYRTNEVAAKLSDPSGNKINELNSKHFFPNE